VTSTNSNKDNKNKKDRKRKDYRQVRLPIEIYKEVASMGTAGNSIGDVIARLLKFYKEHHHDN
jgi:hypothetical protein